MVSEKIVKVLQIFQSAQNEAKAVSDDDETRVKVNEFTSRIAAVYEKLRNTVDYKDEHLLRKNAIERILNRHFWEIKETENIQIAETLIKELIRAGYLPNNTILEYKVFFVDEVLKKYLRFLKIIKQQKKRSEYNRLQKWIIGLSACELEQILNDSRKEKALVEAMFRSLENRVKVERIQYEQEEIHLQLFVAVNKVLVKSDTKMIGFLIFKSFYPDWEGKAEEDLIVEIAGQISEIKNLIDKQIKHPLAKRLLKLCKKYAIYYNVLDGVINSNIKTVQETFNTKDAFFKACKNVIDEKYRMAKKKFRKSLVRSIIYIFLTKMVVGFILEVPLDMYFFKTFSYFSVGINITFPPLLMLIVGISIRHPSDQNTKKILEEVTKIVYDNEDKTPLLIRPQRKRRKMTLLVFGLIYLATYVLSFGLIIYLLYSLHFSIISGIIFIAFLCVVSYFAFKIRNTAKEWFVLNESQGFFATLIDFFFMPIIKVGQWMSQEFSKINVFMFILDVIIETPFKAFLAIFEDWMSYVREKKEEMFN